MTEPVDLLAALQRSVERARAARRACPECGAAPDTIGTPIVTRHEPGCGWTQWVEDDRAEDLRMWGE